MLWKIEIYPFFKLQSYQNTKFHVLDKEEIFAFQYSTPSGDVGKMK